ncbi:MAG: Ig-like domain-containing protein, partial [Planctomycetota bacterium]|nr:Ig-like domain-containing protein [Planctomycetota bacterium]
MLGWRPLRMEMLEKRELMAADAGVIGGFADAERSLLLAEGEAQTTPIVEYVIRTLAPGTDTPITSILAGRDFDLQVRVRDLRIDGNNSRGVYAAFLDVLYDKSLAKVRVAEMQRLIVAGNLSGTFTLSMGPGQTTSPISYDLNGPDGSEALRGQIEAALNNLLGAGTVQVRPDNGDYLVRFTGQYDVDFPDLIPSIEDILVFEGIKGDINFPPSFAEAFRSFDLGLNNGLPGLYQVSLSAKDAADRIDELGAQVGLTTAKNSLTEVTRGRVKSLLPGKVASQSLVFAPDFTQMTRPIHNTLVLADITATAPEESLVPNELISALPVTLIVEAPLFGTPITATVDEDSLAGITIPILPHVTKHAAAPAGAKELRSFTQPAGGLVTRIDPNNTPADLSDDLLKFVPSPNFSGTTSFTYLAGIAGDSSPYDTASNTVTITVNPVNDAPVISSPSFATTNEDTALVFGPGALSVSDVDADPAGVQVTLSVTYGSLHLPSAQGLVLFSQQTAGTLSFVGTTSAVNAALAGLTYYPPPNFNGQDLLRFSVSDLGHSGSGSPLQRESTIAINVAAVNDKPMLVVPPAQTVYSVNTLAFSQAFQNAISVYDVDAETNPMNVTVVATGGIGTLSALDRFGAQVSGNNTASLSITGYQFAVNDVLATLVLTPPAANATGTLSITVNDQQHNPGPNLSAQGQIGVTVVVPTGPFGVNDAPSGLLEGSASYIIDVLANDLTNGTAKAALKSFTQPVGGGTVERFDPNNTPNDLTDDKILYRPPLKNGQPDLDFFVPPSLPPIVFTYKINEVPETLPDSTDATVSIRILNVADIPVAVDDGAFPLYATTIDLPLTRTAAQGLLANDTNIDNTYGDVAAVALSVAGADAGAPLVMAT